MTGADPSPEIFELFMFPQPAERAMAVNLASGQAQERNEKLTMKEAELAPKGPQGR
jgi:hypothetical protein